MRDLSLQCTCVRVGHAQECQFAITCTLMNSCVTCTDTQGCLVMHDGEQGRMVLLEEDNAAGPLQHT